MIFYGRSHEGKELRIHTALRSSLAMVTCDPAGYVLRACGSSVGTYFIVRSPTERALASTATCLDAFTLITLKIPSLVSGSVEMSKCPSSLPFVMSNFTFHAAVDGESPSWTPRRNTPWLARPSKIWMLYCERWSSLSWRKRNTVGKENREEERKRREMTTWMLLLWLNLTTKDLEACLLQQKTCQQQISCPCDWMPK